METTEAPKAGSTASAADCVRVAVNIRPLITPELLLGCTDCITVVPGEPQVQIGSHVFTFDHVYGSSASSSQSIYSDCVGPLVDSLFHGYNATVLAYGQTGSGKTYTMGTNYTGEENSGGIIPKVMESIFSGISGTKENVEFLIRVSFIEIFKEEVFDLLEGASGGKPAAGPTRAPIQIRETTSGGITLAGVIELEVRTKEEMASFLSRGSLARATASTNMNSQSSRSHAIFTITMEQKKTSCSTAATNDDIGDDIFCAKLHLVDLAGSERAKRTGADGLRLKEGIHINKGLLALGNVISALGDEKKRKEGGHVPYRDSKLTRLLQDSLGGNSKTVMIACVSPADTNAEETLNTLKYANRARNIQNKAIINRDPMAAQMQRMRNQIEQLQGELLCFRGEGGTTFEELQILKHKVSLLEASKAELHRELRERQIICKLLEQRAFDAQVEKDKLVMKIESARNGKPWDEIDSGDGNQDVDLLKTYVGKIQELERELLRLQSLNKRNRNTFIDCLDLEDDAFHSSNQSVASFHNFPSDCDGKDVKDPGEVDVEKELEHSTLQDKLDRELQELNKCLEQKEAEMKRFGTADASVLKQHYEKKVQELEQEKKSLMKEIEDLRFNLANISSTSDDGAQKLKAEYLQKLNFLESQVSELKKKQNEQSQLMRQKLKSDEAAKRLQEEIHKIKCQKVQLQQKIKQESEQFRMWKASREKEVLQLKKEGRRNEYEMHKLLALNQRQRMVLQRKTEEASLATKKLKEVLEAKKAPPRGGNLNGRGLQALMQAIEHELEVITRVHEVRSEYERQMEERAAMAKEVANLKEEAEALRQKNLSDCSVTMSPGARNSRIFALENMLATSSSNLVLMASQLSEAEERERVFGGKGRWNQIPSLAEAKNVMNHLFNLASSSRCLLRDKELDCREKDSTIRELKDKVFKLNSLVRQMEMEKDELRQEMLQRLAQKCSFGNKCDSHILNTEEGHVYNLRKAPRSSTMFNIDILEDMDTSESEQSDSESLTADEDWVESGKRHLRRKGSRKVAHGVLGLNQADNNAVESPAEETICETEKPVQNACCSCSKKSFCKTNKCECRARGSTCGQSCGCVPSKCANRDSGGIKSVQSQDEGNGSCTSTEDIEKNRVLASQGAMLLQSAMADKPIEMKHEDSETERKPLSDIGNNSLIKSNAPRKDQRKKWGKRKSTIQLVPLPPSLSTQSATQQQNNVVEQDVLPLKLPRAMRSTTSSNNNSNTLRERNDDSVSRIEDRQTIDAPIEEKENRGTSNL